MSPGAFLGALAATREHPRQWCRVGSSRLRCRSRHVDICDEASVSEPFASSAHRAAAAGSDTLTSAMKHSCRNHCLVGSSRQRCESRHVDICDEASLPEPFASMTDRVILGRTSTLTSAIKRSCCCEHQGRFANASAQWFSVLHFRRISTSFHNPVHT